MRKAVISFSAKCKPVIVVLILCAGAFAFTPRIALPKRGAVASVDEKTFTCRVKGGNWTYQATPKTAYWLGNTQVHLSDLTVGADVRVTYHLSGKDRVADDVRINPKVPAAPRGSASGGTERPQTQVPAPNGRTLPPQVKPNVAAGGGAGARGR